MAGLWFSIRRVAVSTPEGSTYAIGAQAAAVSAIASVLARIGPAPDVIELPPGFEHRDRDRVRQVEAAVARTHRQPQPHVGREMLEDGGRQPFGFGAEYEHVVARIAHVGEEPLAARRKGEHAPPAHGLRERTPGIVDRDARVLVVVEARALPLLGLKREAERTHPMQARAGVGGKA